MSELSGTAHALVLQWYGNNNKYTHVYSCSEHPESTKAYFRRAKAKQSMSLFEEALDDLNQIVKIDSSLEEDVAREKAILRRKARAASQKQKQEFSNFFSQ